jgi:hypothetical protein
MDENGVFPKNNRIEGWEYSTGRKSKLTPRTLIDLQNALVLGLPRKAACSLVRISPETLHEWLTQGRRDLAKGNHNTKEARALIAVEWAESEFQRRQIQMIQRSGQGGMVQVPVHQADGTPVLDNNGQPVMREVFLKPRWDAAAWSLERRFPDSYGKRDEVTVHTDSRPGSTLSSEEPDKVISLYEQARALLV